MHHTKIDWYADTEQDRSPEQGMGAGDERSGVEGFGSRSPGRRRCGRGADKL